MRMAQSAESKHDARASNGKLDYRIRMDWGCMKRRTGRMLRLFFGLALALCMGAAAGSETAPYVLFTDAPHEPMEVISALEAGLQRGRAAIGDEVTVPAVGTLPEFKVKLRGKAQMAAATVRTSRSTPLMVVADTHGEYEILVQLLRSQRIIDSDLRWSFRGGHLVFLGDVFDRGSHQTEILWLIYKLEAEAARAGGGVHLLLGNHELMVLSGDNRYLNEKYLQTARAAGVHSYADLFSAGTLLGQWLRTKPAVLKLNDLLCLHGGIAPEVIERKLSLHELNSMVAQSLPGAAPTARTADILAFVKGKNSPLWYRGYFPEAQEFRQATAQDVDAALEQFGVSRILVGHTPVDTVTPLYGGKVIAVQVYPHRDEGGHAIMEAVRIERGRPWRAGIDGSKTAIN